MALQNALEPQTAFTEIARQRHRATPACGHHQDFSLPLLQLPDHVVVEIVQYLPARNLAMLQTTCRHLSILLQQDWLWQAVLKMHDPVWVASGVSPVASRGYSKSWKQLVMTSVQLQSVGIGGDVLVSPQAVCSQGLGLWNSGQDRDRLQVQLDYHLCHTEGKSSRWRQALGERHFRAENIADLMEFIYFLWFEAKQLCRAAHMLAKVVALLAEDRASAPSEAAAVCLGYSTMQMAISAACTGCYLTDLLHMRCLSFSPMSAKDPATFLRACQGEDCLDEAAGTACECQFEWCGGYYAQTDLLDALVVLQIPYQHQKQPIPSQSTTQCGTRARHHLEELTPIGPHRQQQCQERREDWGHHHDQAVHDKIKPADQFENPWLPDTWAMLGREAESLLTGLQSAEFIPWEYLQRWGTLLKQQVTRIATGFRDGCVAPSDACRGYALFAANTLINRLHSGPDSSTVYAETGRLYDSAKQYRKAAHYYKLHIVSNSGRADLPGDNGEYAALICLAGALDWDSVETGALHSYQQAFAWQRTLVSCLVTNADKPVLLSKQCNILADMLSSRKARHAPHLHVNTRLVLAVGAYQSSERCTGGGPALLDWLQACLPVLHLAEQAFLEFLKDADKAFNMIIQHAARRRGHRDQSNSDSSSASLRDETVDNHVQQAAVVFTSAHVDFVTRLGDVMSRLPGGRAGCSLFALAASIRNQLTTAKS